MFVVNCPHCKEHIFVEQLNCRIFRHGVYKHNMEQINPHLPKAQCDQLFITNAIYGCGNPFKVVDKEAVVCDYI